MAFVIRDLTEIDIEQAIATAVSYGENITELSKRIDVPERDIRAVWRKRRWLAWYDGLADEEEEEEDEAVSYVGHSADLDNLLYGAHDDDDLSNDESFP